MRRAPGRLNAGDGRLVEAIREILPFGLTPSQEHTTREIRGDLVSDRRMLRLLSGRPHVVHTGVALVSGDGVRSAVETTRVWFSVMTDEDISWYIATGEPVDRAGAYAIQGLASRFIPRIEGSYSNVVGLPVALVSSILSRG